MKNRSRLILIGLAALVVAAGAFAAGAASRSGHDDAAGPGTSDLLEVVRVDAGQAEAYAPGSAGEDARGAPPVGDASAVSGEHGGGGLAPDPQLQGLLDRKIVQSTSVDLGVEEVGRSFQEIIRVAETNGGFVASSAFSNVDDEQIADLTVRVPAGSYQDVLAAVRAMGEVSKESSDANDVTEEYTDLAARLRTLEASEQRYLALLAQARTIEEILVVQDRLDGVRGQIEQVQGRVNLLDHLTDLATITVHLRPLDAPPAAPPSGPQPLDAAASAWEHSLEALRGLAAGALVVAVFSWWLVPPAGALWLGARWWLARRPRPA
ncbi:MAG: DUF4349 domain-containing protein, partial [Chloroflexi bacterium]|nr:DUF4349 domain-containing protein [Chloroflexota bacterium]